MSKYDSHLKCSFCGKSQEQVRKLIAGPGVYICDECVELCNEILDEELMENAAGMTPSVARSPEKNQQKSPPPKIKFEDIPKPREIKAYLDGIPITNGSGETELEDIDLSILNGLTVYKGPSSSIYGAGLGGMINLEVPDAIYNKSEIN